MILVGATVVTVDATDGRRLRLNATHIVGWTDDVGGGAVIYLACPSLEGLTTVTVRQSAADLDAQLIAGAA